MKKSIVSIMLLFGSAVLLVPQYYHPLENPWERIHLYMNEYRYSGYTIQRLKAHDKFELNLKGYDPGRLSTGYYFSAIYSAGSASDDTLTHYIVFIFKNHQFVIIFTNYRALLSTRNIYQLQNQRTVFYNELRRQFNTLIAL